jgi:hypothetical protein
MWIEIITICHEIHEINNFCKCGDIVANFSALDTARRSNGQDQVVRLESVTKQREKCNKVLFVFRLSWISGILPIEIETIKVVL